MPIRSRRDRVAVVHNGIIENFLALKARADRSRLHLPKPNRYRSRRRHGDALSAVRADAQQAVEKTLARLDGAFALVMLFSGHSDLLICARRGSPLAIGYGEGEMYVAGIDSGLVRLGPPKNLPNAGNWTGGYNPA